MSPAKKKKQAAPHRKKPCPPPDAPPPPPPPVLTAPQRRFGWRITTTRSTLGTIFFTAGLGVLGGHWFYHREWHTPSFVGSMIAMLFGTLLIEPQAAKDAGSTIVGWAKELLRSFRKSDPSPPSGQ